MFHHGGCRIPPKIVEISGIRVSYPEAKVVDHHNPGENGSCGFQEINLFPLMGYRKITMGHDDKITISLSLSIHIHI